MQCLSRAGFSFAFCSFLFFCQVLHGIFVFIIIIILLLCAISIVLVFRLWVVGCTTSQLVEGFSLVQSSKASLECVKAPSPRAKPPKKSFSTCSLVRLRPIVWATESWKPRYKYGPEKAQWGLVTNSQHFPKCQSFHRSSHRHIRRCHLSLKHLHAPGEKPTDGSYNINHFSSGE